MNKVLKSNKTSLSIQSELIRTRQNNSNVIDFSSKIKSLIEELNAIQISHRGEEHREVIIFKSGIRDNNKSTVGAGRPSSLNEAINLALDAETPQLEAKVLAFKSEPNNPNHYKKSNGYSKSNSEKSKFCKYCKKKGHEIGHCFKKKKADNKKANRNSERPKATRGAQDTNKHI